MKLSDEVAAGLHTVFSPLKILSADLSRGSASSWLISAPLVLADAQKIAALQDAKCCFVTHGNIFFGYEWLRLTIYKSCVCTLLVFAAFKFGLGSRSLCFNASNFLSQMVYLLLTVAERTNCVNKFLESSVSTNTFYKVRPRRSWKVDIIQDLLSYWHSKSCRKGRAPAGMNNANFSLQSWPVSADQKQGDSRVKRRLLFDVWL